MKTLPSALTIRVVLLVVGLTLACNLPRLAENQMPSPAVPPTDTLAWSETPTPSPSFPVKTVAAPQLSSFTMLTRLDGWALSENALLRTEDGGASWLDVTPIGLESGFGLSASLACLDARHAWLLIPLEYPVSGMLYRTTDGGQTWLVAPVPFSGGEMDFLDAERGWILADLGAGAGSQAVAVFRSADGGATWTQVYVNDPTVSGASDTLPLSGIKSGLGVLDFDHAWVGGSVPVDGVLYLYASADGGRSWTQQKVTLPAGYESAQTVVNAPRFFGPQEGVFFATLYAEPMAVVFYVSHDGGRTWTATAPLAATGLYAIASATDFLVWDGGPSIHFSRDGGLTWETRTTDVDLRDQLAAFQFTDAQYGWALTVNADGHRSFYRTTDGGAHWTALIP